MIDFSFISELEGGQRLDGYVPECEGDKSGVTIAMGIDLGQMGQSDLRTLPDSLEMKLTPYIGLKGQAARNALAHRPLHITAEEADLLETPVKDRIIGALSRQYLKDAASPFEALPDAAQTVLASVSWQYGSLESECPKFWGEAIKPDFQGMYNELENFGDPFPTRRKKEAAYLKSRLPNGAIA